MQFFADVLGIIGGGQLIGIVNHLNDHIFDFFNQDCPFIIQQLQSRAQ